MAEPLVPLTTAERDRDNRFDGATGRAHPPAVPAPRSAPADALLSLREQARAVALALGDLGLSASTTGSVIRELVEAGVADFEDESR